MNNYFDICKIWFSLLDIKIQPEFCKFHCQHFKDLTLVSVFFEDLNELTLNKLIFTENYRRQNGLMVHFVLTGSHSS